MSPQSDPTLSTTAQKVVVTVFPPLPASGCGGSSCSCSPGVPAGFNPTEVFLERLHKIKSTVDDRLHIEVAQYTTKTLLLQAMDRLNLILRTSGSDYAISIANLAVVLTTTTPIVAVNDVIVTIGGLPAEDQFLEYIETV